MVVSETASQLLQAAQKALDSYFYPTAEFLAERVLAADATNEKAVLLLAESYSRQGKWNKTYNFLSHNKTPSSTYLFAFTCFKLKKYEEAETALLGSDGSDETVASSDSAYLHLCGLICLKRNQNKRAENFFRRSLQSNCYDWASFEALCNLGVNLDVEDVFQTKYEPGFSSEKLHSPESNSSSIQITTPLLQPLSHTPMTPAFLPSRKPPTPSTIGLTPKAEIPPSSLLQTPSFRANMRSTNSFATNYATPAIDPSFSDLVPERTVRRAPGRREIRPKAKIKLFPSSTRSTEVDTKTVTRQREKLFAHKMDQPIFAHEDDSSFSSCKLLQVLGTGYKLLIQYKSREALSAFQKLPKSQYFSPWVLECMGKAYFELVDFSNALRVFEELRKIAPYRMEGMAIYSTILWHLRKDAELSFLSQEALELDKTCCESWCIVGNCFSRLKEHDLALKFFRRALQLDSTYAYAHTLSGHEYVANDDLDKALSCFREAIVQDPRHYNAWYGIGMIYYRQEKYSMAEYHFKRALQINPRNSVLQCYLGMVYQASNRYEDALYAFNVAIEIDDYNSLAHFKKASVLMKLDRLDESLTILNGLQEASPKEAPIYFLMGRIWKKRGMAEKALHYFMIAMDLDSKNSNYIKSVLDKFNLSNTTDDDSSYQEEQKLELL